MISFDINQFEVRVTRHAIIRAFQRKITPDMVEAAIRSGKIERFGKCNLRFIKEYKKFRIICVGNICGDKINIFTVVIKW